MRTTITLEPDVLARARQAATKNNVTFRYIVNEALRAGLAELENTAHSKPYHEKSYPMGLKAGKNLDNIGELLAVMEGEDHR